MNIVVRSLTVFLLVVTYGSAAQAEWGNLTGRFVYDGPVPVRRPLALNRAIANCNGPIPNESLIVDEKTLGVSNIVVYVSSPVVKVHPDYEATATADVTMAMEHCRFNPHVVLVRVGQTLVGENKDPVGHNFNINPPGDAEIGHLLTPGPTTRKKFKVSQGLLVPIYCNIHGWMTGFVLCRDNPYMAVTKQDGSFEIKQIPAGELEFQFLHEKTGYLVAKPEWTRGRAKFTIEAGKTTDLGEIKLDPKLFARD